MEIISIILNYNDSVRALELALKNEKYTSIKHIIIVDNCSTDNSLTLLKTIKSEKITVIVSPKNGGFASGNNYGIRYAFENFVFDSILLTNTDTVYDESIIVECHNILYENPQYGVISPRMKGTDGIEQRSNWNYSSYKSLIKSCFYLSRKHHLSHQNTTNTSHHDYCQIVDVIRGSFMLFKKEALCKTDLFDEYTFLYGEETNICKRLLDAGYKSVIANKLFYIHDHVEKNKSNSNSSKLNQWKLQLNAMYYFQKEYCNINWWKKIFAQICMKYSYIEFFVMLLVRKGSNNR